MDDGPHGLNAAFPKRLRLQSVCVGALKRGILNTYHRGQNYYKEIFPRLFLVAV